MEIKFNTILKKNRKKVNMTQEELAIKTEIERTYMSKLESENSNPAFSTIEKLCSGLGMTLFEFFGGIDKNINKPAIVIYENKHEHPKNDTPRIKSEMVPIKVIKRMTAFSFFENISDEFVSKYIYVEKDMFSHPEDIIALEMNEEIKLNDFKFKKPILLIDIVNKNDIESQFYFIVEPRDKEGKSLGVSIQKVADMSGYIIFADPSNIGEKDPFNHVFPIDEFEPDFIRGRIIAITSKIQ